MIYTLSDQQDKEYICKIHGKQLLAIILNFGGLYCAICYDDMIKRNCCLLDEKINLG